MSFISTLAASFIVTVAGGADVGGPVYVCDEQSDWLKIFYSDPEGPCGKESPGGLDVRRVTTCKSGWVKQEWIEILSG